MFFFSKQATPTPLNKIEHKARALACQLKIADMAIELRQYDNAISLLEKSAREESVVGNRSKHLLKALFCHVAKIGKSTTTNGWPSLEQQVATYKADYLSFEASPEYTFISTVLIASHNADHSKFVKAIHTYDDNNAEPLDHFAVNTLLTIKQSSNW